VRKSGEPAGFVRSWASMRDYVAGVPKLSEAGALDVLLKFGIMHARTWPDESR
jgi:hypothetical protein